MGSSLLPTKNKISLCPGQWYAVHLILFFVSLIFAMNSGFVLLL
jgi:hypothetical protein